MDIILVWKDFKADVFKLTFDIEKQISMGWLEKPDSKCHAVKTCLCHNMCFEVTGLLHGMISEWAVEF